MTNLDQKILKHWKQSLSYIWYGKIYFRAILQIRSHFSLFSVDNLFNQTFIACYNDNHKINVCSSIYILKYRIMQSYPTSQQIAQHQTIFFFTLIKNTCKVFDNIWH